jgi:hypothetical protein
MSGHECGFCRVERVVVAVKPVIREYAMKALECPKCKSVLSLVVKAFPKGTASNHFEKQSAA